MERLTHMSPVMEKWAALKLDKNVRAVFAYDPNGRYHDSWMRKT